MWWRRRESNPPLRHRARGGPGIGPPSREVLPRIGAEPLDLGGSAGAAPSEPSVVDEIEQYPVLAAGEAGELASSGLPHAGRRRDVLRAGVHVADEALDRSAATTKTNRGAVPVNGASSVAAACSSVSLGAAGATSKPACANGSRSV